VVVNAIHSIDGVDDYSYNCTAIISTPAQRVAVFQQIKDEYTKKMDKETEDELFLAGLNNTLTNALNDWENE